MVKGILDALFIFFKKLPMPLLGGSGLPLCSSFHTSYSLSYHVR